MKGNVRKDPFIYITQELLTTQFSTHLEKKNKMSNYLFLNFNLPQNSREHFQDPNILAKDLVAKNAFAEMDANNDGVVSMEEFVSACLGDSELCQLLALKAIEIFED